MDGKTILGQLTIPSVVFRGHGLNEMLCRERVEYAWLMDIDVGCIEGAIATEQVSAYKTQAGEFSHIHNAYHRVSFFTNFVIFQKTMTFIPSNILIRRKWGKFC